MTHKIGIVLSGGGGKGAYQAGVWKALEEYGISEKISVFSGTSVGALNAFLFAQENSEAAIEVWKSVSGDEILYPRRSHIENIISFFVSAGLKLSRSVPIFIAKIVMHGIFSRKGLSSILDRYLNIEKINQRRRRVYAACTRLLPPKPDYFLLNEHPHHIAKQILLASSAIPVVFGKETINGVSYYDGGILDNTPIAPVYNEGCNIILTVFLNREDYIDPQDYPNSKILSIYPKDDPGGFWNGVLDFGNPEEKIRRGYEDAKRVIQPMYDMAKAQFVTSEVLDHIQEQRREFENYLVKRDELFKDDGNLSQDIDSLIRTLSDKMKICERGTKS